MAHPPAGSVTGAPAATDSLAPVTHGFHPADWETLSTLPERAYARPVFGFRYNRVDGPTPTLGGEVRTERSPAPLIRASASYAFSRERFLYEGGFEAPLGDPVHLRIGAAAYRRTATEDAWIVTESENTLFALFARTDYRDYYESEGFEARVIWEPGRDFALSALGRMEDQRSLQKETDASLFGDEDDFRPNPPIVEGDDRAVTLGARVGPSEMPWGGGTRGDLTFERAGDPFDGDFDYGRVRAAVHGTTRLSPRQTARGRLMGGSTLQGDLPPQKLWHVGGIGTLRGQEYKEKSGDQFLLANAEYYLLLRKNVWGAAFLDWGSAWFGKDNLSRQQFLLDGGIGIRIGEGPLMVTLARNLQRGDAPLKVAVRFGDTF